MEELRRLTRRHFFRQSGFGIAGAALASVLHRDLFGASDERPTHLPAKATSVIYLFMAGGPSQLDLFDPKPKLNALDGSRCPDEILQGERFAFVQGNPRLLCSPYPLGARGR